MNMGTRVISALSQPNRNFFDAFTECFRLHNPIPVLIYIYFGSSLNLTIFSVIYIFRLHYRRCHHSLRRSSPRA
ncbi:hypothetical protein Hanom_Chr17g01528541 [Helianthus anomalus]